MPFPVVTKQLHTEIQVIILLPNTVDFVLLVYHVPVLFSRSSKSKCSNEHDNCTKIKLQVASASAIADLT